jgi:hypothetical protein
MKYIVGRYYKSAAGEYQAGQIIEIGDADYAAWLNRDMGGYLEPVVEPAPAPEVRAPEAPPADRMVRKAQRRSKA